MMLQKRAGLYFSSAMQEAAHDLYSTPPQSLICLPPAQPVMASGLPAATSWLPPYSLRSLGPNPGLGLVHSLEPASQPVV